ncbi:AEC family transporter [Nocardia sp. NBC_01327]|uniref:AEC family transporter n=1 Tax=Nocardia sp. NBC_01327 TaxID=2903593 RepID=UPI002E0DCF7E|nr:AEC family transporter [Nocardia sp. NBC_01327]
MTGFLGTLEKLAPVALICGAGVLFARRKIIDATLSKAFSEFAFRFAIPAYLLGSFYRADLRQVFNPVAIAAYTTTAVLGMIVVATVARTVTRCDARATALRIMAACQVNTTYFAIPVFLLLFGDATPIFPVILLQVCVLTVVVIAIMESTGTPTDPEGTTGGVRRGLRAAVTTPIVVACYAGIAANLAHLPVPGWATDTLSMAGAAASPVALFALGLHLGGSGIRLRGTSSDEYWLVTMKCLLFPLLAFTLARYVFGIGAPWLTYLTLIAAMPAPQNLFIFAAQYDTDVDLAASVVIKTSVLALLLLPMWAALAH